MAEEGKKYVTHGMYAECSMGTMKNYLNTDVGHGVVYQGQPLLNANDHAPQINLTHFGDCNSKMIYEEAKKQLDEKYKAEEGDNFLERAGKAIAGSVAKAAVTAQEYLTVNKCQLDTPLPWRFCNEEHMIDGAPALTMDSVCPCKFGGIISIVDMTETETEPKMAMDALEQGAVGAAVMAAVTASMAAVPSEETLQTEVSSEAAEDAVANDLYFMPIHAEPLVYPKILTEDQQYENAKYIFEYLKQAGWSDEAACGAIGNFTHEGVLNPAEWQSSSKEANGYGLAQWTRADETILVKLAEEKGVEGFLSAQKTDKMALENPRELMNMELEYLLETANDSSIWGAWGDHYKPFKMKYEDYMTASVEENEAYTAENLAYVFCAHYERPRKTTQEELKERAESAGKWYKLFCEDQEE